jgi:hypothetical protein
MSDDAVLLKSQRNTLFQIVRASGFEPREFHWEQRSAPSDGAVVHLDQLVHDPSGYFFMTGRHPEGGWYLAFSPADDRPVYIVRLSEWSEVLDVVPNWLEFIRREFEVPDLWAAVVEESRALVTAATDDDNRPFAADEREVILERLDEIRRFLVETHELSQEQVGAMLRRLDYLQEASTRMGRKDWLNIAWSVLFGTAVTLGLGSGGFHELMRFASAALRPILGYTPLP